MLVSGFTEFRGFFLSSVGRVESEPLIMKDQVWKNLSHFILFELNMFEFEKIDLL